MLVVEVGELVDALNLALAAEGDGAGPGAALYGGAVRLVGQPVAQPVNLVEPGLGQEREVEVLVVLAGVLVVEDREHARAEIAQNMLEQFRVAVYKVRALGRRPERDQVGQDCALGDGGLGGLEELLAYLESDAFAGGHLLHRLVDVTGCCYHQQ